MFLNTLSDKIYFNYEYIVTLISCCQKINTELQHMSESLDYKDEIQDLREELVQNINDLIQMKESIQHQFPGLIKFIQTKRASYHLLQFQKKQIDHFEHLGMITDNLKESWTAKIDKRLSKVDSMAPLLRDYYVDMKQVNYFLLDYPMFNCLNNKELRFLQDNRYLETFNRGGKCCLRLFLIWELFAFCANFG